MSALNAFFSALDRGLRIVAALCLAGLFALMLAQVALRYTAIGVPAFAEELARYAMVWMALVASAVAVREGSHIRIDFVPLALASVFPFAGRLIEACLDALTLGICLVIFWQGLDIVAFAAGQRSEGLRIPLSWPYAAIPVTFGLAALLALVRLIVQRGRPA
jgi:TRAP-type transport system small permease protein